MSTCYLYYTGLTSDWSYHQPVSVCCWCRILPVTIFNITSCLPTIIYPRMFGLIPMGTKLIFLIISPRKYVMDGMTSVGDNNDNISIYRRRLVWLLDGRPGTRQGTFGWENSRRSRRKKKRLTTIHWSNTRLPPTVITITVIFIQVGEIPFSVFYLRKVLEVHCVKVVCISIFEITDSHLSEINNICQLEISLNEKRVLKI